MTHAAKSKKDRKPRDGADFYTEPAWSVEALLPMLPPYGLTLDPACGSGTIPKVVAAWGKRVGTRGSHRQAAMGTDLHRRWRGQAFAADFLAPDYEERFLEYTKGRKPDRIICNPPFKDAARFVDKAKEIALTAVAMVLPLSFLAAQKRQRWLQSSGLTDVLILSRRPSMPPGDLLRAGEVEARGGSTDYAWLVWSRWHMGSGEVGKPPHLYWIPPVGADAEE